jgi:hypothetical protein
MRQQLRPVFSHRDYAILTDRGHRMPNQHVTQDSLSALLLARLHEAPKMRSVSNISIFRLPAGTQENGANWIVASFETGQVSDREVARVLRPIVATVQKSHRIVHDGDQCATDSKPSAVIG